MDGFQNGSKTKSNIMNEPKKQKVLRDIKVNVKTLYRPFKQCFKRPANTITKWIFEAIRYDIYQKTECVRIGTPKTSGRFRNRRYASIKGCCGLQRNGYLR